MRAQDTSTKCKHRKLRDIGLLVSEKASSVLDWIKTSIWTPTLIHTCISR